MYTDIKFRSHFSQQKIMKALKASGATQDLWKSIVKHVFSDYEIQEDGSTEYKIRKSVGEKHEYSPYSAGNVNNEIAPVINFRHKAGIENLAIICEKNLNDLEPFELPKSIPSQPTGT